MYVLSDKSKRYYLITYLIDKVHILFNLEIPFPLQF